MTFTCYGSHSINDLNYPSITLPNLGLNSVTVTRTVTNVGPPSTYTAKAQLPGYKIVVVPSSLKFKKIGEKKTFKVTVQATSVTPQGKYEFGELRWSNGKHIVRSPITLRRENTNLENCDGQMENILCEVPLLLDADEMI
jgi:hypothetical protein